MKHILLVLALFFAVASVAQTTKQTPKQTTTKTTTAKKPAQTSAQQKAAQQKALEQKRAAMKKEYEAQFKEVEYTINGKAHGYESGEWVKLYYAGPMTTAFDSVQLNGEDFTFSGKTLSIPHEVFMVMGQGLTKTIVEIFLEQGTINVDIVAGQRVDKVTGTKHNDIYSAYRDSINSIYTDIFACIREAANMKNSESDRESYKLGEKMLREKLVTTSYDFTSKNATNWVGMYLLVQYYKRFTKQQNQTIISRMPQKFQRTPAMAEIKKFVATQN